jgi:hypothetical protein
MYSFKINKTIELKNIIEIIFEYEQGETTSTEIIQFSNIDWEIKLRKILIDLDTIQDLVDNNYSEETEKTIKEITKINHMIPHQLDALCLSYPRLAPIYLGNIFHYNEVGIKSEVEVMKIKEKIMKF